MEKTYTEIKEERLQKLFKDCQTQILNQIIGPFGLSTAMFEDRNGGNVTTIHNFSRDAADYIAEKDKASHAQANKKYNRDNYESHDWDKKSQEHRSSGIDGYTGKETLAKDMDLDHVTSMKEIATNKKANLALNTGESLDKVKAMANSDENLVATHKSINRSKSDQNITEFSEKNGERFDLDKDRIKQAKQRSESHINSTVNLELAKKQSIELFQTSGSQAVKMGLKEGLGILLVELINGLFNEFVILFKQGVNAGESLFKEMGRRLKKILKSVIQKIPNALESSFQGSISGLLSNLVTFIINNFLSTAKRYVTVIRDGFLGLLRAFKMIFFPPKNMTSDEALQEGLKILSTVIVSSIGVLLNESISAFLATVPFIKPIADLITPVLLGVSTGLISVFISYQIDSYFEGKQLDRKLLDTMIANSKSLDGFLTVLEENCFKSLENIQNYSTSLTLYQNILDNYEESYDISRNTLSSLERVNAETAMQISKSNSMINHINDTQSEIELFLSQNNLSGI